MSLHDLCFAFEAAFISDLRCIPMAVRRKLDLAGIKLRLTHWNGLTSEERQRLLGWQDDPDSVGDLRDWLERRTSAMVDGPARRIEPATDAPWQQTRTLPEILVLSCRQLGVELEPDQWGRLDELQRFALVKLSHPGHEHRNLGKALAEFGLVASHPNRNLKVDR